MIVVLLLALLLLPTPPKQPMVRCNACGAMNDPSRGSTRCVNCNLPL